VKSRSVVPAVFSSILLAASLAAAPRDRAEFDRQLLQQLAAQSPEAAALFAQANAARERDDQATASQLYGRVRVMVPGFVAATRRQAGAELNLGRRDQAIKLARQALKAEPGEPANHSMLALALSRHTEEATPTVPELAEALRHARQAATLAPDDSYTQGTLCQVAVAKGDLAALKEGAERLLVVAPKEAVTHQFVAIARASEGKFAEAEKALAEARALGMPEDQYQAVLKAVRSSQPVTARLAPTVGKVAAVWGGALVVLLAAGLFLSQGALRAAETVPTQRTGEAQGASASLRRAYAVVLWLCCAYYYVSIPLLIGLTLLTGGGLIYMFFAIGRIPVKLVAVIAIVTLVTLWSILKSLFVRVKDEDPGLKLDLRGHPRLKAALAEVAARVGTAPVQGVYLTPGTEVAVMERGGLLRQLRGAGERCLILGVGVLDGLRLAPFKAVLAHEYGHFSNRDTAGGGFAISVRRSLGAMGSALAQSGAADWYNPVWLFLNGFLRVFLRISQGASRLQEVMADRWAAFTYGSQAFEEGLRHVIERAVRFDAHAGATLQEVIEGQQPLANLYSHRPSSLPAETELGQAVGEAMGRPASAYDSHPSPGERIRWVRALAAAGEVHSSEDAADAWSLFADRERIEQRLTGEVRENILRAHGIKIAGRSEQRATAPGR
jgi:Zn-dependent protease with chaperone function